MGSDNRSRNCEQQHSPFPTSLAAEHGRSYLHNQEVNRNIASFNWNGITPHDSEVSCMYSTDIFIKYLRP